MRLKWEVQVDEEEFFNIEKRGLSAKEYGAEILGLIRYNLNIEQKKLPRLQSNFTGFHSTPGKETTGACRSF